MVFSACSHLGEKKHFLVRPSLMTLQMLLEQVDAVYLLLPEG